MKLVLVMLVLVSLITPAGAIVVTTEETGEITFLINSRPITTISGGVFGQGWQGISQSAARDRVDIEKTFNYRALRGELEIPGTDATLSFDVVVQCLQSRRLRIEYHFRFQQEAEVESVWVSVRLPLEYYGKESVLLSEQLGSVERILLPMLFDRVHLYSENNIRRVSVAPESPLGYEFHLNPPAAVLLQDNRQWGGAEFVIRMNLLGETGKARASAGTELSQVIEFELPKEVNCQLNPESAVLRTDTSDWTPFVMSWDDAPIDLSWLNETPAGVRGFVLVKDGQLVFEDSSPARFFGVNLSAGANFPTHEQARAIAARIAKFGLNIARTHHADAGWSNPNFFDESTVGTRHFDAEALDRFDYFVYQLKEHGIYIYLDQLVHRKFTEEDGVENTAELDYAAKPYTIFDPHLIQLQQEFSQALWTHTNPYTGLAYKDDPAIALMDFTNENDLLAYDVTVEPYASRLEERWRQWAKERSLNPDQPLRLVQERTPDIRRFLHEVQCEYYEKMHTYLRGIGVKVPITGNTWLAVATNLPSQATMDFMNAHAYWDHPYDNYRRFHNHPQVCSNPADRGSNPATLSISRVQGTPFVNSEWGHPWPNEWRAEGPLSIASIGSLQDWDGIIAYTYRHSTDTPVERITGAFDTFNDPCVFGLMPAAALLFRRGDVTPPENIIKVAWTESELFEEHIWTWNSLPAYRSLVERSRVATVLGERTEDMISPQEFISTTGPTWIVSDTGELWRDWESGVATINTPRTQAAYGFLGARGAIELADVIIEVKNDFAAVAVTSLDERPIRDARRVLITAVARAENDGMVFNLTRSELREPGRAPILIEPLRGKVAIHRSYGKPYAIGQDGARRELAPVSTAETTKFNLMPGTIYWEFVR